MKLSIRRRLQIIVVISMFAILLIGAGTILVSLRAQTSLSYEKLTAIRDVRAAQVEQYFGTISGQVVTMAENLMVIDAMREFRREFDRLQDTPVDELLELRRQVSGWLSREYLTRIPQTLRPSDASRLMPRTIGSFVLMERYLVRNRNPVGSKDLLDSAGVDAYDDVHERYHPVFRSFLNQFGYYDIFLVEPEDGTIVYSVFKEADFGTELVNGPYGGTGIGKAFQAGRMAEKGTAALIDFREYLPSYAAPASFISTPIYDGEELIGVLIFQMPVERIEQVMTGNQGWIENGLGLTGETYLVGPDRLLRSEARPFLENTEAFYRILNEELNRESLAQEIATFDTSILHMPARNLAIDAALQGEADARESENYLGQPTLAAYAPLDIAGVNWVIIAEMQSSEALASVRELIILASAIAAGLLVLLIVVVAMISRSITRPLGNTVELLKDISEGSGDLTVRIQVAGNDEIGQLSSYFNTFVGKLHNIVSTIKEKVGQAESLSDTLMASSEESSAAIYQISQNLNSIGEQVSGLDGSIQATFRSVQGILATVDELTRAVETQRAAVDSSSSSTEEMVASIQSVSGIIAQRRERSAELMRITQEGGEKLEGTLELISRVQRAADKIMEAVSIIRAISDQTNLLAMNAAIEAAHAGDAGRGFSVVADEIRKLSETSRENSAVISENITESVELINQAMAAADLTGSSFDEIQREVEIFIHAFGEIAASMGEVSEGSSQILDSIASLTEVSRKVGQESDSLGREASGIRENITTVRDVSNSVSGSIAEIDTGVREITAAATELAELGQNNREYLQNISAEVAGFTTGAVEKTDVTWFGSDGESETGLGEAATPGTEKRGGDAPGDAAEGAGDDDEEAES
jgi:methyl-accepting chemotaxis protein